MVYIMDEKEVTHLLQDDLRDMYPDAPKIRTIRESKCPCSCPHHECPEGYVYEIHASLTEKTLTPLNLSISPEQLSRYGERMGVVTKIMGVLKNA